MSALLALAACDTGAESRRAEVPPTEETRSAVKGGQPLTASGPAQTLSPESDANLQWAASVVQLHPLESQNAKLFGTANGDPAMNGLYAHIAFFRGPAEGWRVFRIGDFLSFKVLRSAPGRVDLEVEESTLDQSSGRIGSQTRRLIVGWMAGAEGAAPAAITVAPAA
jgi:hypothetical protein